MALVEMAEAHREGRRYGVDGDLKSFFDTVNHSLLMHRVAKRMSDRRVLRLIGRYLRAGVILPDGRREPTACGGPPGFLG
jgi:RNA-directed DNA polymerase